MTRATRYVAIVALAVVVLVSCARLGSGGSNAQPADIYAAGPSVNEVRILLGDDRWWQGPPSFGVPPLDTASRPATERFSITQRYLHIGSAEELIVTYIVFDKTSTATTRMTTLQNAFGASPTSPKEGDQVLYYGLMSRGAAPFVTRTFVRLGPIVTEIDWSRKDGIPTVQQLGRNAAKVVEGLKKVTGAKARLSTQAIEQRLLPPPGLDITLLGSAQLPIETWLVMDEVGIPDPVAKLLRGEGVTDFVFGDYALNDDTRMEVRTALLTFVTATDATDWLNTFSPGPPDNAGIGWSYLDNVGEYHYLFTAGTRGAMLVCSATVASEAASRACETPMLRTATAWKLALTS